MAPILFPNFYTINLTLGTLAKLIRYTSEAIYITLVLVKYYKLISPKPMNPYMRRASNSRSVEHGPSGVNCVKSVKWGYVHYRYNAKLNVALVHFKPSRYKHLTHLTVGYMFIFTHKTTPKTTYTYIKCINK